MPIRCDLILTAIETLKLDNTEAILDNQNDAMDNAFYGDPSAM